MVIVCFVSSVSGIIPDLGEGLLNFDIIRALLFSLPSCKYIQVLFCSHWLLSRICDDAQQTQDILCEWALLASGFPGIFNPLSTPQEGAVGGVGWDWADAVLRLSLRTASPLVFQSQMYLVAYKCHSLTAPTNNN